MRRPVSSMFYSSNTGAAVLGNNLRYGTNTRFVRRKHRPGEMAVGSTISTTRSRAPSFKEYSPDSSRLQCSTFRREDQRLSRQAGNRRQADEECSKCEQTRNGEFKTVPTLPARKWNEFSFRHHLPSRATSVLKPSGDIVE